MICVYDSEDCFQVGVIFVHSLQDTVIWDLKWINRQIHQDFATLCVSDREKRVRKKETYKQNTLTLDVWGRPLVWALWWRAPLSTAGSLPCHTGCCWPAEDAALSRADQDSELSLWRWPSALERSSLNHKQKYTVELFHSCVCESYVIAAQCVVLPVLLASNSWKALMRSDLCTNSCSLRARRADLSVHPTLTQNRERKKHVGNNVFHLVILHFVQPQTCTFVSGWALCMSCLPDTDWSGGPDQGPFGCRLLCCCLPRSS